MSLALARNEDNALRCIFHGWKYDVSASASTCRRSRSIAKRTQSLSSSTISGARGCRRRVGLPGHREPPAFPDYEFRTIRPVARVSDDGHRQLQLALPLRRRWIPRIWGSCTNGDQVDRRCRHHQRLHRPGVRAGLQAVRFSLRFDPPDERRQRLRARQYVLTPWFGFIPRRSTARRAMRSR